MCLHVYIHGNTLYRFCVRSTCFHPSVCKLRRLSICSVDFLFHKGSSPPHLRLLIRSSDFYLHMVVSGRALCGGQCANYMELVDIIGREMKLCCPFQPAQYPAMDKELLKIDEVSVK